MSDNDEARRRVREWADSFDGTESLESADVRAVLDALDAAERNHAYEVEQKLKLAAVIERALENPLRMTAGVQAILQSAPSDALRAVKAEAWFAGYDKGNLDGYFGTSSERARSPYADLDPYRETKEQSA